MMNHGTIFILLSQTQLYDEANLEKPTVNKFNVMSYNIFASYAAFVPGCNALDLTKGSRDSTQATGSWKQMGCEEKRAAVQAEIKRVNKLPPNSSYASHRMRVLNKVLELMSMKRTMSQDEELELLFAGLSI
ncbi:hypothetical protein BVC80_155g9 [Macleaya cordata]|uniref:Uncharacterized protein n=1 Tax=Macleaya cordata TaxID=56857 RepID=A0A200RBW4_MACCD|nr:hypothetical protein BVC80_155g9 [Macleaya cordata]